MVQSRPCAKRREPRTLQAILFDLDGTLLDIDLGRFMPAYFEGLREFSADLGPTGDLVEGLYSASDAMMEEHPGRTNQQVFTEAFLELTGVDIASEWRLFQRFYEERFDGFGQGAQAAPGAHDAVSAARDLGVKTAVATNPMFPRIAVEKRMAWAGFTPDEFDLVTTYETMYACKPWPAYYLQIAEMLDVPATECLMVGDDPLLDMPARAVGMTTFYVGARPETAVNHTGDLFDLVGLLPGLVR